MISEKNRNAQKTKNIYSIFLGWGVKFAQKNTYIIIFIALIEKETYLSLYLQIFIEY